jgi:hypothetical protein
VHPYPSPVPEKIHHTESGKRLFAHVEETESTEYFQDQYSVSSVPSACECCFSGVGITRRKKREGAGETHPVLRVLSLIPNTEKDFTQSSREAEKQRSREAEKQRSIGTENSSAALPLCCSA